MKIITEYEGISEDFGCLKNKKISKEGLILATVLENDPYFEDVLINIRKECGIPLSGFDINQEDYEMEPPNFEGKDVLQLVKLYSYFLTYVYNLPMRWMVSFHSLIMLNLLIEPPTIKNWITYRKEKNSLIIEITENKEIKHIMKALKEDKKYIKNLTKDLPRDPINRMSSNLKVKRRMLEIRRSGEKLEKVGDYLITEFGNELMFDGEDYNVVGAEISKFRKKIKDSVLFNKERSENFKKNIEIAAKNWKLWEEKLNKNFI